MKTVKRLRLGVTAAGEGSIDQTSREVHFFHCGSAFDQLADALTSIGYDVIRNATVSDLERSPRSPSRIAIIDDVQPEVFDTCRLVSVHCPVVLATADRTFERSLCAVRAGAKAIVTPPFDLMEVVDWLDELIGQRSARQLSVLIVDDDEILSESYALAFQAADIKALVISDPMVALEALSATSPDILLLDMQMPGASGLELAGVIRQSRKFLSLPIVFLSAENDPAKQLEARRLGGDDFIAKPVDMRRLVTLVRMRAERSVALRSMMERDGLTGLYNHASFNERLAHELERSRRNSSEFSLALFDLDRFKSINDAHGHLCGDRVIRAMARTLTMGLRRTDIVGRLGGEEFGLLMLDTPPSAAALVANKLRTSFSEIAFKSGDETFNATFSGGVSGSSENRDVGALIEAADAALYHAKREGRNRSSSIGSLKTSPASLFDASGCASALSNALERKAPGDGPGARPSDVLSARTGSIGAARLVKLCDEAGAESQDAAFAQTDEIAGWRA